MLVSLIVIGVILIVITLSMVINKSMIEVSCLRWISLVLCGIMIGLWGVNCVSFTTLGVILYINIIYEVKRVSQLELRLREVVVELSLNKVSKFTKYENDTNDEIKEVGV